MTLTVEKTFDWDTFTERFWDRRPVLYKGVDTVPFAEPEVFRAAVLGSRPPHPLAVPGNLQFLVRRRQQTRPYDYLPEPSDGSFDGYERRMADRLDGQRYALVVHRFHSFSHPLWDRARRFYAGLWERVGQPTHSVGSTMFHGSYEHSPVGVHQDRFATFMFCVRGAKRMRFWAQRPWSDPVHTVLDYQPYLASSFVAEVEPGDLLYWPSRYYHVGESAGDTPATSVNVGVPRREHRPYYEIKDLFRGTRPPPPRCSPRTPTRTAASPPNCPPPWPTPWTPSPPSSHRTGSTTGPPASPCGSGPRAASGPPNRPPRRAPWTTTPPYGGPPRCCPPPATARAPGRRAATRPRAGPVPRPTRCCGGWRPGNRYGSGNCPSPGVRRSAACWRNWRASVPSRAPTPH